MVGRADTIAALATPPGPARRGVLRLSGPRAAELIEAAWRPLPGGVPFERARPRWLARGRFADGRGTLPALLLWMRAPRSFTREDVAELHLPGAEPLLACALARMLALGARAARPGEFTRRAFEHGRIDLSRAEGVLAVTEAENEAERAAAALLLEGGLEERVAGIREQLLELATLCEASLDFDEADTGHVPEAELAAGFGRARAALAEALAWEVRRAPPSARPRVLLAGPPNAGKSTLWNALTGGRALVSPLAGTTRDALEADWRLAGQTCRLLDGPGEEAGGTSAARRAQELFARARRQADLVLWVVPAGVEAGEVPADAGIVVRTQSDRLPDGGSGGTAGPRPGGPPQVLVSALRGKGLEALGALVEHRLAGGDAEAGTTRLLLARHREALQRSREALEEGGALRTAGTPLDLVAETLRASLAALEELSGRTTSEDVLDRIFARFCLGK